MQAHTEERFENRSWSVFQSVAGVAPPPPLVATRNLPTHSFTCSDVSGMLRVARSLASPMENASPARAGIRSRADRGGQLNARRQEDQGGGCSGGYRWQLQL